MPAPARIVLASANPGKARELAAILDELAVVGPDGRPVDLLPRPDEVAEVVEDADDFEGNARLKAAALADATGEWALADDSGLLVDALDGAPGVHSARYAGPDATDPQNVARLLAALDGAHDRRARFACVLVLRAPGGDEVVATGEVVGRIAGSPAGDGGFGYDPVFVPDDGDGRTFAQMAPEEKHAVSHRGRALRSLATRMRS